MRAILLGLLLLPFLAVAQESEPVKTLDRPPVTLRIAPFALVNPVQQSISFQGDIPLSPKWGIDLGVGYALDSGPHVRYVGESFRGLKLKPALRYYLKHIGSDYAYISLVYKYNNIYNNRYIFVTRQGRQYQEYTMRGRRITSESILIQVGGINFLGKNKRFVFEPFLALGPRRIWVKSDALPPGSEPVRPEEGNLLDLIEGTSKVPDFMMGFNVGWRLGKFKERR